MSDKPRTVWIGTDTGFVMEQFRNEKTEQLITGVTTGTCDIYTGESSYDEEEEVEIPGDQLIVSLPLTEVANEPGSYEVLIPDDQTGLTEGVPLRLQFNLSGGPGLSLRLDAKAIARVKKDTGL